MAERKPVSQTPHNEGEFGSRIVPTRKVNINRSALLGGALYDGPEKLEALYRHTTSTVKRLEMDPAKAGKPATKPPRGGGNTPNMLDVRRWLDSITDDKADADDLAFALTIHATVRSRLSEEAAAKIHAE